MSKFTGGKLKLKGVGPLKPAGGVKKKKKTDGQAEAQQLATEADPLSKPSLEGYVIEQKDNVDRRTAAEKRFADHAKKVEAAQLEKQAGKSYRERIKDFNDALANLSEHHDIPKVGPG